MFLSVIMYVETLKSDSCFYQ